MAPVEQARLSCLVNAKIIETWRVEPGTWNVEWNVEDIAGLMQQLGQP